MKRKTRNLFFATMVSLTVSSNGATLFTEDFSDNSASPNMATGTGHGSPTTDFTGDFTITSGENSRRYLGTNDTDYSTINFVFEADASYPTNSAWSLAFLGMGSSNADSGYYGEPTTGPDIGMGMRPDENRLVGRDDAGNIDNSGTTQQTIGLGINVVHGMRMEWNATTMQAIFMFDLGNDGTSDPARTFTLDGSNNGFNASNSQLFVGGGNGVTFDNISVTVVPEPSAALLGGLGVLGLLRRRRA